MGTATQLPTLPAICTECGNDPTARPLTMSVRRRAAVWAVFTLGLLTAIWLTATGETNRSATMPAATWTFQRTFAPKMTLGELRQVADGTVEPRFLPRDLEDPQPWLGPLGCWHENASELRLYAVDKVETARQWTLSLGWPSAFVELIGYHPGINFVPDSERMATAAGAGLSKWAWSATWKTASWICGPAGSRHLRGRFNYWVLLWTLPICVAAWYATRTAARTQGKRGIWKRWVGIGAVIGVALLWPRWEDRNVVNRRLDPKLGTTIGLTMAEMRRLPNTAAGAREIATRVVEAMDGERANEGGEHKPPRVPLLKQAQLDPLAGANALTTAPLATHERKGDELVPTFDIAPAHMYSERHTTWGWDESPTTAWGTTQVNESDPGPRWTVRSNMGWVWVTHSDGKTRDVYGVLVPRVMLTLGMIAIVPVLLCAAATVFVDVRSRRRVERGSCATCGYDLRAP